MTPLNPFELDLQKTTLIEASAGTGKTYTITTLVVRLIVAGYPIESILVVTFTEAAAAELKLRIRARLSQVLAGMGRQGSGRPDAAEESLDELIPLVNSLPKPDLVYRRISLALTCFDQASIMTIHAFCLQVLKEHAFETGTPFDMELLADASGFLGQVSMDYFMTRINDLDPLMLKVLAARKITPLSLAREMAPAVARPGLRLIPPCLGMEDVCGEYRQVVSQAGELLADGGREVADLIQSDTGLNKRSYSKRNVPAWLGAALQKWETEGEDTLFVMTENGDSLYRFTRTALTQKTKPGARPPEHLFFDLCQDLHNLYQLMETNVICIRHAFVPFHNQAMTRLKHQQGQYFFDDLVNDLARALESGPGRRQLIRAVQEQYEACLIDEFQDTDPTQYRIFSTLFANAPSRFGGTRPFFMIGDPKQAIYAFRGGDIFAYLKACKDCDQRFTLGKNYRSSPLLVQAVNDLFSVTAQPFLFDDIPFNRVGTPDRATGHLMDQTGPVAPLRFDLLSRENLAIDTRGFLTKETAGALMPRILARAILQDLAAGYMLQNGTGTRVPVGFGNMAVLVRTNQEVQDAQDALSRAGIPSYLSKTGSVFDSPQALEFHDILWSVFRPDHVGFMKAALASSVFGLGPNRLKNLSQGTLWQWQERFRDWKLAWETRGFIAMIMDLLHSGEGFLHPDSGISERGLTNFYHLVELTSQAALQRHLSMFYLIKWYQAQLFADTRDEAADELRLESDQKAVAIVTIHKSKGLEYPIVYLPYLWSSPRPRSGTPLLFHDPDAGFQLCMDLRGGGYQGQDTAGIEKSVARHALEAEAEQRRLVYVAVTRASAMCRIFWAGVSGVETSALGSLIHRQGCATDADMISDLSALAGDGQKIQVHHLEPLDRVPVAAPDPGKLPEPAARQLTRQVRPAYHITSFSAMADGRGSGVIPRDQQGDGGDEANLHGLPEGAEPAGSVPSPHRDNTPVRLRAFPRGARAGDFFHAVLEHIDFQWDYAPVAACVAQYLHRFGFTDAALMEPAAAAVQDILTTPLWPGDDRFCLKNIAASHRMTETEFLFDVNRLELIRAADLVAENTRWEAYARRLNHLVPESLSGFVKGFIDLVVRYRRKYFIIDYKSNFLGDTYGDYDLPAMTRAMADHHYVLQYHLYTLALHRYLGLRKQNYRYETDFGGILYLFIRGMHPDRPGSGVFHDRPGGFPGL